MGAAARSAVVRRDAGTTYERPVNWMSFVGVLFILVCVLPARSLGFVGGKLRHESASGGASQPRWRAGGKQRQQKRFGSWSTVVKCRCDR